MLAGQCHCSRQSRSLHILYITYSVYACRHRATVVDRGIACPKVLDLHTVLDDDRLYRVWSDSERIISHTVLQV
jgi:hypothetical protein